MDFITLVDMFKELSGRSDFSNAVCCMYLNAGQKFLDDYTDFTQQPSHYIYNASINQVYLNLVAQAKSISELSVVIEHNRVYLVKLPLVELQSLEVTLPSYKSPSIPEYYAIASGRIIGGKVGLVDKGTLGVIETGSVSDKLGILFNCPLDKAYTVDIGGKFYSPEIVEDSDPDTFWAINYPFTLLHAAMYKLEVGYRNSEGMKDWLGAIGTDLKLIDFNKADEESNSINVMRG